MDKISNNKYYFKSYKQNKSFYKKNSFVKTKGFGSTKFYF